VLEPSEVIVPRIAWLPATATATDASATAAAAPPAIKSLRNLMLSPLSEFWLVAGDCSDGDVAHGFHWSERVVAIW
jgi:hypothetical protein